MTFIEAVTVTLEALATPVIAIGGGIALTAATYHAYQGLRRLIRWAWPPQE